MCACAPGPAVLGLDAATLASWRSGEAKPLTPAVLSKIRHALTIHADLASLFGVQEQVWGWMRRTNHAPLFAGLSALD